MHNPHMLKYGQISPSSAWPEAAENFPHKKPEIKAENLQLFSTIIDGFRDQNETKSRGLFLASRGYRWGTMTTVPKTLYLLSLSGFCTARWVHGKFIGALNGCITTRIISWIGNNGANEFEILRNNRIHRPLLEPMCSGIERKTVDEQTTYENQLKRKQSFQPNTPD